MACDPNTLPTEAGSLCCIPPGMQPAVQSYLLARIRGGSMDVNQIVQETACQFYCIPPGLLPGIRSYLLCQLSNTGGGGGEIPSYPECDADAQAFITAAGITDDTVAGAICVLVRDLKAYPAVGTKYWDREILIYPFASNPTDSPAQRATRHAFNLKAPTGTNNLTYVGAGLIHSDRGIQGDGVASCCRTQYLITSQNAFRGSWYVDVDGTVANRYYYGTLSAAAQFWARVSTPNFLMAANDLSNLSVPLGGSLGLRLAQRNGANNKQGACRSTNWVSINTASTGLSTRNINLFVINNGGVAPIGSPADFTNARISSFSFGSPLDVGGGNTEHLEYKSIWDAFHNTLGRGHL